MIRAASLAIASLAIAASVVNAHTNMAVPVPKFPDGFYNGNSPFGRINGDKFGGDAASIPSYQGVEKIAAAMKVDSDATVRQLIMKNVNITMDGATKTCGKTLTDGARQPFPTEIDFPWGHPGPCEAWCDNTRIFFNANCQGNSVGKIPVPADKCKGASFIQAMYVGVHVSNWEVYANCAPIEGGSETDAESLHHNKHNSSSLDIMVNAASLAIASIALAASAANAHTNMAVPKLTFPAGFYNGNSPYGRLDSKQFTGEAASIPDHMGVQKIAAAMKAEGNPTLRQFIMKYTTTTAPSKTCGMTLTTGERQPMPTEIDFPWGHPGPCEAWCDNTRIFFNEDCQGNNVGKIPVPADKCKGTNFIQAMYAGVHVSNYEIYSNCAAIQGGTETDADSFLKADAPAAGGSSGGSTPSKAPTTPSLTPAPGNGGAPKPSTGAPAPKPTTGAPAPGPKPTTKPGKPNCTRRLRKNRE
ncbi:hypothetical protein Poli38472_002014 [Pythium oligandrum]|uniref:Uncharacterized protein n=1 Tax=Pythium oligandrum TaxID=41045 RepID=A0A8K1CVT5_PYTOL|nr:hypothetical protein Poli38472_002014 [Pythium oligandrum]|eukprot:TMW69858.1 hypothetical protein Poli38472_002014 [Pythium oligandrum]